MGHNWSRRVLVFGFGLSLLLVSERALGQQAASDEDRALSYDELIQRGVAEYQRGHWIEARAFFAEAHAVQPNARTLRGLGMTCYQLGKYVDAIANFEQALVNPLRPLNEDLRSEVTRLLRDAERMVARVRIDVTPAEANLRVDGQLTRPNAQGVILLDAGTHEILAHAPGHESVTRTLATEPGQEQSLTLELRSFESAAAPEPVTVADVFAAPVESEDSEDSPVPWIIVGVSGVVLATGAVLLGVALADKAAIENAPPGENTWEEVESSYERVPTFSAVGIAMLSVGAAGVAAGLAWRFWPESETQSSATLTLGPLGLRASGNF